MPNCVEVLKTAINSLKGTLNPGGHVFNAVHSYALNPKSITMGQLYGEFDAFTHEWTDGILSNLIRVGTVIQDDDKRWYLFDGPVDAVWIENLNSVLDDNKKLCLTSGEIIKLTDNQTLMFEVMDLAVASPATVSRCGMIYLEPSIIGLKPFVECWMEYKIHKNVKPHLPLLTSLFNAFLEPALQFVRNKVHEIVGTVNSNLTFSFLRILGIVLRKLPIPTTILEDKKPMMDGLIACYFIFSLIWSIGATCDNDGRKKFDQWIRQKMNLEQLMYQIPREQEVYDYRIYDPGVLAEVTGFNRPIPPSALSLNTEEETVWIPWLVGVPPYVITSKMKFSDILIPTADTVRNTMIIEMLLLKQYPVLCVGPTGTGKTATIVDKLSRGLPQSYMCDFLSFSARTSANQVQDLVDYKLDKRRKGVYGPPVGKAMIFFIDDMNMPAVEVYGAQPPIELLRQFMDYSGWYDRKKIGEFRNIVDCNFICAMGPPGGGRNQVTPRILRHFNFLSYIELEESSKIKIFGTILHSWLGTNQNLVDQLDQIVTSSLCVYSTIIAQLLPTPAKSHYSFNLRDLSKIFQGLLMANVLMIPDLPALLRLWYHENSRVYQDRLVNTEDRIWFQKLCEERIVADFDIPFDMVVVREPLLYADFLSLNPDQKMYEEITDMVKLTNWLEEALEDYNQNTRQPMRLVLFTDAIKHLCQIGRIVRQPGGNALLLGMGGSGRQSLTRLAAHINETDCFQIELVRSYGVVDWREDLKTVLLKTGLKDRNLIFLFSDTQIKNESFIEDLNSILNSGEVPNIFAPEEMEPIYGGMKDETVDAGLTPTKSNMYSMMTRKVRSNLRNVITMSPIGEVFRTRLRQFPALVNCCTINWFSEWPEVALQSVARNFLDEIPDLNVSEQVINATVSMCQLIHQGVSSASERFFAELSRHNYVTPKSYLELLSTLGNIHSIKILEISTAKDRMLTGLEKLLTTAEDVKTMQIELEILRPLLVVAAKDTEVTMQQIEVDTQLAEDTKVVVKEEEEEAARKAAATQSIADDAQRNLDEVLPALDAALASLKSLNKGDVVELRAMQNPPAGIKLVIEAVCIMKGVRPKMTPGEKPGQKIADYWEPGRALLHDPARFLESLFKFDKENISDETIRKITVYMEDPNFSPEAIAKVSKACTSICQWVRAMFKYSHIAKVVGPKREALATAQVELARTMALLTEAKGRLNTVEDGLKMLNDKLTAAVNRKKELEENSILCEKRLITAAKLIEGLKEERLRWQASVEMLQEKLDSFLGDIVVASGTVAYLGPFTESYRSSMMTEWIRNLDICGIPHTSDPSFMNTLGDPVKFRMWHIAGLPKDNLSIQNSVIVQYTKRWPLFIDPQGQANKWIKNMENGIVVFKLTDKDILRYLERAIRDGTAALMENVGEELDPSLDSILLKQVYRQEAEMVIRIGDTVVSYDDKFRFYMTTSLPNPHYTPEVALKVTVLNFTLAPSGLEDQLLAAVVAAEREDLEEAKNELIVSNAQMKQDIKDIEDQILLRLSLSEGNPVDDVEFIEILEASKMKSIEIKGRVAIAEEMEKVIDETRMEYIPVAVRAQILFFCMSGLTVVDPMYQYSLEWFQAIFANAIHDSAKSNNLATRIENINEYFTYSLFTSVCRSLFEKHKLMFAFLLATRIEMNRELIDMAEWRFLLAGGSPVEIKPNPDLNWISERSWNEVLSLAALPNFKGIINSFKKKTEEFKHIFDAAEPHRVPLPEPWEKTLSSFQKILILRAIRPDKVTNAFQDFVAGKLGQKFIEPQTSDLTNIFKESSPMIPMIFILSTGTDPGSDLNKFAEKMKFGKKMSAISLGQGQGPRAEVLMNNAMETGQWVFLQNCHLAPSWMPTLERLIETINPDLVHVDCRVWLSSMPSPKFPVYILQNSAKMTVEPPRGIKANLLKVFLGLTDEYVNSCRKRVNEFKYLVLSLILFHAVVVERRKFGPLGFNIAYDFTDGDLQICISQLYMFLQEYEEFAFKVLKYTAGQINYGGRITDDWDRRCVMNILDDFYSSAVMDDDHIYDPLGQIFHQINPQESKISTYVEYIRSLPINDDPEIFGLHDNANITFAQNELFVNLNNLLLQQPKTIGGKAGESREDIVTSSATYILEMVVLPIKLEYIQEQYPIMYEESMNTVLVQEIIRYNRLLEVIHGSLPNLKKALVGLMVLTQELEDLSNSLFNNMVPTMWKKQAFWISGLYFPQAFLTGTLQNFARRKKLAIDTISFGFQVQSKKKEKLRSPSFGCYIYGLFIEGARWDQNEFFIVESRPKELFTEMPCFWFIPMENKPPEVPEDRYLSPVYKTLLRAGTLSTTGHSTNFVLPVEIPSNQPQSHWIKRGTAMICALDY